jgi:uncharacterized protein YdaU (DUF1376 family)
MRDTAGLSMLEECAYHRLLGQYYSRESPLPLERSEVYRLARVTTRQERQAVDYVVVRFFVEADDGWHQKRADEELRAQHERAESARRSVQVRWAKRKANASETKYERNTNVSETYAERNTNHKPETNNQEEPKELEPEQPKPTPRKRGSRLPADWAIPDDWIDWARTERADWDARTVLRVSLEFRDHWLSKGEARADWQATWRNWVRRQRDPTAKINGSAAQGRAEVADFIFKRGKHGNREQDGSAERDITGESERVA